MVAYEDELQHQREVWDAWAQHDSMWAILSDPELAGGKWDPDVFFASGHNDVTSLFGELERRGIQVQTGRCLDFGCGIGRLSLALAERFERVDGVDISHSMVEQANRYNTRPDACTFHVNVADDLSLFPSDSFDMVFTRIVLQHNPPPMAEAYIREFIRVLRPAGVAVFDMPAGILDREPKYVRLPEGAHCADLRLLQPPNSLTCKQSATVSVEVTNTSAHNWPDNAKLRLGNHWCGSDGAVAVLDDGRAWIGSLAAGETRRVELPITAPLEPGRWKLVLDVVEEGVAWFADRGSATFSRDLKIRPVRRKLRVFGGDPEAATPEVSAPEPFTMNAIPRERVIDVVHAAGGEVLDVARTGSAGPEWEAYTYFVRVPQRS